jgi:hypothetical protein
MNLKLTPVFIILGLFIFKVGVLDNFRNYGHHSGTDIKFPSPERARHFSIR